MTARFGIAVTSGAARSEYAEAHQLRVHEHVAIPSASSSSPLSDVPVCRLVNQECTRTSSVKQMSARLAFSAIAGTGIAASSYLSADRLITACALGGSMIAYPMSRGAIVSATERSRNTNGNGQRAKFRLQRVSTIPPPATASPICSLAKFELLSLASQAEGNPCSGRKLAATARGPSRQVVRPSRRLRARVPGRWSWPRVLLPEQRPSQPR